MSSTTPSPVRSVTSRSAPRAATATGTESRGPVTILTTRSRWSKATMRLLSGSGAHDEPPSAAAGERPRKRRVKPPGAGDRQAESAARSAAPTAGARRIRLRSRRS